MISLTEGATPAGPPIKCSRLYSATAESTAGALHLRRRWELLCVAPQNQPRTGGNGKDKTCDFLAEEIPVAPRASLRYVSLAGC